MKKQSFVAVALIGLLLGVGNAGAMVVCFGADGHIEVVSASEEHCCECPSHAMLAETGHQCASCFDVPLLLGCGEAFLLPAGSEVRDLMDRAEYGEWGRFLSPNYPDSPEDSLGTGAFPHKESQIAFLSSVVLLI